MRLEISDRIRIEFDKQRNIMELNIFQVDKEDMKAIERLAELKIKEGKNCTTLNFLAEVTVFTRYHKEKKGEL